MTQSIQPQDEIALQALPIEAGRIIQSFADPEAGGISIFLGTTRSEVQAGVRQLIALDYESYGDMARQQLHALAVRARQRWPIVRLAVLHRIGRVPLGQPSVLVAVAAPHRAEAFEACRWLIDTLKAEVAIWKKEIWDDGTGTWSGGEAPV